MPEPKRVRDESTGHEYSTYAWGWDGLTVLDEPAVDVRGDLLPPKHATKTPAVEPAKPTEPTQGRKANTQEA